MGRWVFWSVVASALACATTPKRLTYPVVRGDSLQHLLDRHIDEIRAHIGKDPAIKQVASERLSAYLLEQHPELLLVDLRAGERLEVTAKGVLTVVTESGQSAPLRITSERLSSVASRLRAGPGDEIHKRLAAAVAAAGLKPMPFALDADGKTVRIADTTYLAGEGVTFVGEHSHFHVVGKDGEESFTVSVWPIGDRFSFPESPFISVTRDKRIESKRRPSFEIKRLVSEGQLMEHDGCYHLTRAFAFEPWQKLVARAANEELPPVQRKLAAEVEAALLGYHVTLSDDDFASYVDDTKERIVRTLAALDRGMTGPQLTFVVQFDASLEEDGHLLRLGEQVFHAGEGLVFGFCRHHIHVMDERNLGVNVALRPPGRGEKLSAPDNAFIVVHDDRIELRDMSEDLMEMLKLRWIEPVEHVYLLTERINPAAIQELRAAPTDARLPAKLQEKFSSKIEEIMSLELPTESEQKLVKEVKARSKKIRALHRELQRALRKRRR